VQRGAPFSFDSFFVFSASMTWRHSAVVQAARRLAPSFSAAAICAGVA
jgi:hypothetical protein